MEEEKDYYEILEERKQSYRAESENLLRAIAEREELVKLLKIAKPENISKIQDAIVRKDFMIEQIEKVLVLTADLVKNAENIIENGEKFIEMFDREREEFLEHIKREKPEEFEEIKALLYGRSSWH